MNPRALTLIGLMAGSPLAQAPIVPTDHILGLALDSKASTPGTLDMQDLLGNCKAATTVCKNLLSTQSLGPMGGTAYDPRHQSVWVSDGINLVEFRVKGCVKPCTAKVRLSAPGQPIRGLAISDRRKTLFQLDSTPGVLGIVPYDLTKCPPVPSTACQIKLSNPRAVAGGLAYDEERDLLYLSVSEPAFIGWISSIHVVDPKTCKQVCKLGYPTCDLRTQNPVTGLAYDACTRSLYASDGPNIRRIQVLDPSKCLSRALGCCKKQGGFDFQGLAVVPGWSHRRAGSSCIGKGCPFCSNMGTSLSGGDPSIGNREFKVHLNQAPTSAIAVPFLGLGTCSAGISLPFLCGPFHPRLGPGLFSMGAFPTLGSGQCAASATLPFFIPPDPRLCGVKVCLQWFVICQGLSGFGLTGALEWSFASS